MKRQIIYRLTEILSFYAFLRPAQASFQSVMLLIKITNSPRCLPTFLPCKVCAWLEKRFTQLENGIVNKMS